MLNLPESKQFESADRQQEDREFLTNMFDSKMNLNVQAIHVNKLIRLGRRVINKDGIIKPRPLRFTVDIFDHKRQILKAIDFELKKVLLPPPLGNFADISYLEENFKPHLLRDVCTLCSGALVSDSLLHMLL